MSAKIRCLTLMVTFALALIGLSNHANAGFCGNYVQTSSNAGDCDNCRLLIADNPKIQKYFVTANNGWEAELSWTHGDDSTAIGSGRWKSNVGGALGGRQFDIDMNQQGRDLHLTMSLPGSGPIRATFLCLDAATGAAASKNCVAYDRNGSPYRIACP